MTPALTPLLCFLAAAWTATGFVAPRAALRPFLHRDAAAAVAGSSGTALSAVHTLVLVRRVVVALPPSP